MLVSKRTASGVLLEEVVVAQADSEHADGVTVSARVSR